MTIEADLQQRLTDAMKARDKPVLDAIRNVRTEIQRARTAPDYAGDDGDAFVQGVIAAYVKKLRKALGTYEGVGDRGAENAGKLRVEIDYLSQWLPQVLGEDATAALVDEAIVATGASNPKDAGKVMGHVMRTHRDEVDPGLVKSLVSARLGG